MYQKGSNAFSPEETQQFITSYSGQDFKVLFYIPFKYMNNLTTAYEAELKDELLEQFFTPDFSEKDILQNFKNSVSGENSKIIIDEMKRIEQSIKNLATSTNPVYPVVIDSIQTLSYQIHTDKAPVRAIGFKYPKGYTHGQRLIAGSLITTVINEHPLIQLIDQVNSLFNWTGGFEPQRLTQSKKVLQQNIDIYNSYKSKEKLEKFTDASMNRELIPSSTLIDQLPPLNCSILGVNEAGNAVHVMLYGLEFINDGAVLSVQDILTENTSTFVCQDIDIMRTFDTKGVLKIPAFDRAKTASSQMSANYMIARSLMRRSAF